MTLRRVLLASVAFLVCGSATWAATISGNVADYNAAQVKLANGVLTVPANVATYHATSTLTIGSSFTVSFAFRLHLWIGAFADYFRHRDLHALERRVGLAVRDVYRRHRQCDRCSDHFVSELYREWCDGLENRHFRWRMLYR